MRKLSLALCFLICLFIFLILTPIVVIIYVHRIFSSDQFANKIMKRLNIKVIQLNNLCRKVVIDGTKIYRAYLHL